MSDKNTINFPILALTDYPATMATKEFQLLTQQRNTRQLQAVADTLGSEFDRVVAFDDSLKNDNQRKARKSELQQQAAYQEALQAIESSKDAEAELMIELSLLRNQFSVAKLQVRQSIAQAEAALG